MKYIHKNIIKKSALILRIRDIILYEITKIEFTLIKLIIRIQKIHNNSNNKKMMTIRIIIIIINNRLMILIMLVISISMLLAIF